MTLRTSELAVELTQTNESALSEQEQAVPLTDQERRCAQDLLSIITHMRRVINHDREKSNFSITVQQYLVLKTLKEQEHLISELADLFKVSRPTMSRIIDGLEGRRRGGTDDEFSEHSNSSKRAKLVERVDSRDDRRLVYARITPEGLEVLEQYCIKAEESVTTVLRRISPAEMPQLERALQLLCDALETHR
jgi:DNA-binding MarR family transcriptional regulator